jgi:hypothetical protein
VQVFETPYTWVSTKKPIEPEVSQKDLNTFIVVIFCLIDDWLAEQPRYRRRGRQPTISDAEILTIEVVGIWLGLVTDKALFLYFQRHYGDWFPGLVDIHRTTFVRQSANPWAVKVQLWRQLLRWIAHDPMDSMPLPACRFGRANRCRRLREVSAYGYDEVAKRKCFGLHAHARIAWPDVVCDLDLLPANVHDTATAETMLIGVKGQVIADRNYWKPVLMERLREQELALLTPFATVKHEKVLWPQALTRKRRPSLGNSSNASKHERSGPVMPGIFVLAGCVGYWLIVLVSCSVNRQDCHNFDFLNLSMYETRTPG